MLIEQMHNIKWFTRQTTIQNIYIIKWDETFAIRHSTAQPFIFIDVSSSDCWLIYYSYVELS